MNRKLVCGILLLRILTAAILPAAASAPPAGFVALTFDDGPSGDITQSLLDGLKKRQVQATFFVCGYRVQQYPEVLKRIAEENHEIGLHSSEHTYMNRMTKAEVRKDLQSCLQTVQQACGVTPKLFRPPGGLYSEAVTETAEEIGLRLILWSVDPRDWDKTTEDEVVDNILENVCDGSIILMHDMSGKSVSAAMRVIDALQEKGYAFCTVSELADFSGTTTVAGGVYSSFPFPQSS